MGGGAVGLLGNWTDPVAQLLQELPEHRQTRFIEISNPEFEGGKVEWLIALSQEEALAHLDKLVAGTTPCTIILRRFTGGADIKDLWETGVTIIATALKASVSDHISLVALGDEAAKDLSELTGIDVRTIGTLPVVSWERPRLAMDRTMPELTFSMDAGSGRRETRRIHADALNWTHLRRLANPFATDKSDLDMQDLVDFARGSSKSPVADATSDDKPICMVAVVPNGIGLGHITRMMAVGKALKNSRNIRLIFWSYSRAAEILKAAGFEVILRQNAVHLKAHPPHWRQWETKEFVRTLQDLDARLVFYDGMSLDQFVIDALRSPGCGRTGIVWVRRGMLKPETDAGLLEVEQFCDLVIEPGDLAVDNDRGPTRTRQARLQGFSQHVETAPITLRPYLTPYSRREAKRRLKFGFGRHCLASLGGTFGNWDNLKRLIDEKARRYRVTIIWAQSPLAPPVQQSKEKLKVRRLYPLNRYLEAFDGVISAAGYNSFHELMIGFDRPVLFAPTNNDRLDDQEARANHAGDQGWADVVLSDDLEEISDKIDSFMLRVSQGAKVSSRPEVGTPDEVLAEKIFDICQRYN